MKFQHGTTVQFGAICKEIFYYICNSAARECIVKKAKYFEVMLNIFEFSWVRETADSPLVYKNKFS